MDEQELKALMDGIALKNGSAIKEAVKAEVLAATSGIIKTAELNTILETLGLKADTIKSLNDAVDKQGLEMRRMLEGRPQPRKTIDEFVTEHAKSILEIAKGGPNVKFNINKALLTRAAFANNTLGMRLPDMGELPYPEPVISGLFRHANLANGQGGIIRYFDQDTITRGAAFVAEGAQKPESAITWIERLFSVEKVADSIPVTKEAWTDIPFIQSELRRLLEVNISLKIDEELYSGSGVTPHLKGVYTTAPAFVTTPYADTVEAANLFDLIMVVAADIAKSGKFNANTVLINPINALGTKLLKNAQGNYVTPPFVSGGSIGGLRIVESSQVVANTMVVGDFSYGTIYDLESFNIEMGWINDQFIKNCFTILAEQRLGLLIRNLEVQAFRKVTNITTALADLETP